MRNGNWNKDNGHEEQADYGQVGSTYAEGFQPAISRADGSKAISLGYEENDVA